MTNEEIVKLIEAIDVINHDLYNQLLVKRPNGGEDMNLWIWLEIQYSAAQELIVKFLDEYIYNSQDDPREFYEDKNDYEPFEPFLRKKCNELISKLQKVKL